MSTVDEALASVELHDDTLYVILRCREGASAKIESWAFGADEVRYWLQVAAVYPVGSLVVMPVSRTLVAEWQLEAQDG